MLREYIKNYLEKDKSRSNKSNLLKLLISDKPKFDEINNFIYFESTFRQKFYHYLNEIKHKPTCFVCGADVLWVEALSSYRETCSSKCSGYLATIKHQKINALSTNSVTLKVSDKAFQRKEKIDEIL